MKFMLDPHKRHNARSKMTLFRKDFASYLHGALSLIDKSLRIEELWAKCDEYTRPDLLTDEEYDQMYSTLEDQCNALRRMSLPCMPKQTLLPGYMLADNVNVSFPLLRQNMFKTVQQSEGCMHFDVYESMSYVSSRFKPEEQWWMFVDLCLHNTLWSNISAYLSFSDEFDFSTEETHYTKRTTIHIRFHAAASW